MIPRTYGAKMSEQQNWNYIQWDPSKIARFWDFASHWEPWRTDYFSYQVGRGIVNFVQYLTPLEGKVLDYGCGIGDLSHFLLNAGIACEGLDSSIDSVTSTNQRFQGNPLWGGAQLSTGKQIPYEDNTFDFIFFIETIEHLIPENISGLLKEVRRVLKPQTGKLFISTPNSENLSMSQIYCPSCNTVFHRYQHISSFNKESLFRLMSENGFQTLYCDNTHFGRFQEPFIKPIKDWNLNYIGELHKRLMMQILDQLWPTKLLTDSRQFKALVGEGAHLFWMGSK